MGAAYYKPVSVRGCVDTCETPETFGASLCVGADMMGSMESGADVASRMVVGIQGEPGFSPTVELEEAPAGVRITVTNKDGIDTAFVRHGGSGGGGFPYTVGPGLKVIDDTVLAVDTASDFKGDNTRPADAALLQTTVGNIELLLSTI